MVEQIGIADAWLGLNREVDEMQRVLRAVCEKLGRACTIPSPEMMYIMSVYPVWVH